MLTETGTSEDFKRSVLGVYLAYYECGHYVWPPEIELHFWDYPIQGGCPDCQPDYNDYREAC